MPTLLYALVQHRDIAKFEFEDGLVRQAAASLLAEPSTISTIAVDTLTSTTIENIGQPPMGSTVIDALVRITAEEEVDARPVGFEELVSDVARVVGIWEVDVRDLAVRTDSWRGTSTPGVKLSLMLRRGPGIDLGSYEGWLRDETKSLLGSLDSAGVRTLVPRQPPGDDDFDTLLEFSFPTESALTTALANRTLAPILESELLEPSSLTVLATAEHILRPNENAWELGEVTRPSRDDK